MVAETAEVVSGNRIFCMSATMSGLPRSTKRWTIVWKFVAVRLTNGFRARVPPG